MRSIVSPLQVTPFQVHSLPVPAVVGMAIIGGMVSQNVLNLVDTASAYHASEERIGLHISSRRSEYILASKCGEHSREPQTYYDFSYRAIADSIDRSLELLQTDRIDLMQIHFGPNPAKVLDDGETVVAMKDVQAAGKVTLLGGAHHEVDSSEQAFKVAGSMAFKNAAVKANPVLLEPLMKVEVVTPEDYMGDVMGDLNRRRGILQGMDDSPAGKIINAHVPLSEMFGYATDLRSQTQGRATYTMEFDHYDEVPAQIKQKIVAEHQAKSEEKAH